MNNLFAFILFSFLLGETCSCAEVGVIKELKLSQLESELEKIDHELESLAETSLRSGVGAIGYRSMNRKSDTRREWIEIDLGKECVIDEIILVPNVYRDSQKGFLADGFPAEFRVVMRSADEVETVLGEYKSETGLANSIAPYVIAGKGGKARWIRIEAMRLTPRIFNKNFRKRYIFQLAEVFIFEGGVNVALQRPVSISSEHPELNTDVWNKRYLVDGHTPYIMNAAQGQQSVAYVSKPEKAPTLTIDLEAPVSLTGIHLHALDQSDTVPQAYAGSHGFPHHLQVEGAGHADFSDVELLLDVHPDQLKGSGPIMMWRIPEKKCRYVRIKNADPSVSFQIGFAEIELFSHQGNVALGKKVTSPGEMLVNRSLNALTDGRNLYGEILPLREWLKQLARRQFLEKERPKLVEELAQRYEKQKVILQRLSWLAVVLVVGLFLLLWVQYIARQRAISMTRERIAANLHDELGANLHAIGLLGDFAKKLVARKNAQEGWGELNEVIDEVRSLTEETGETARYCTNMLESKEIHANLVEEMTRTSKRLLSDLKHEVAFPSEDSLHPLKPRRRIDLYLFYKECLTNIIRHSGASQVTVELTVESSHMQLIVEDDGYGIKEGEVPASLRRRAKMLNGKVYVEGCEPTGTRVCLKFSAARKNPFKKSL